MRLNNAITPSNGLRGAIMKQEEQSDFSKVILGTTLQNQIAKSVPNERSRARFTASIIEAMNSNTALQACSPASVVSAALRGEGQGLILGHGYYVVPYGTQATYITSYRGYISLAMATGMYNDIDCFEVREGERQGRDMRTGKIKFNWDLYPDDEERNKQKIIGYYAYFELKDGFFRNEYWSMEKLLLHAERYSPAFSIATYNRKESGDLSSDELKKLEKSSPWYNNTDRMCKKTVLRSLLNSGFAPLSPETRNFIAGDTDFVIPAAEKTAPVENDPLIIDAQQPKIVEKAQTPPDARESSVMAETNAAKEILMTQDKNAPELSEVRKRPIPRTRGSQTSALKPDNQAE